MKDTKIQWHPGFVAAMNLEFAQNRDDLIFEKEHNLNTKPLEIDLLVIKKEASAHIANEIGIFFRGHNIIEYKSPEDRLDIDTFYKSMGYACLYKSYGKTLDGILADDVTVSIIRESKPKKLMQYFREHGYTITNLYQGVYYIGGKSLFPAQIVVTAELDKKAHVWLGALSAKLKKQDMRELIEKIQVLTGQQEREFADSVLEVSIEANLQMMEELRGDVAMGQALMEFMKPQLQLRDKAMLEEGMQKGMQKGLQQGIQGTVNVLRKYGFGEAEIRKMIMEQYKLSADEAKEYF